MRRSKGLIAYGKLAYANTRLRLRVGRGLVAHDLLVVFSGHTVQDVWASQAVVDGTASQHSISGV